MHIKLKNIRVRTIIGFKPWEREQKQDVIINVDLTVDCPERDDPAQCVDYKVIAKKIIHGTETAQFQLLERLAAFVHSQVTAFDGVKQARVEVDKPGALRFVDSVSVVIHD